LRIHFTQAHQQVEWTHDVDRPKVSRLFVPVEEGRMTMVLHGKIHGRTIELAEDLGLAEGQEVEVSIRTVPVAAAREPGDGLLRTEGALADDPYWDAIMEEIYQARRSDRRPETPDLGEP